MVWTLNGGTVLGQAAVSTAPGAAWQVLGSADYNGDGKSDIELQNSSTGQIAVWLINGTTITSRTVLANIPARPGISLPARAADFVFAILGEKHNIADF